MKNRNNVFITIVSALAFALAPIVQAAPSPDGGPTRGQANAGPTPDGGPTHVFSRTPRNATSEAGAKSAMPDNILPIASINFAPVGLALGQTARLNLVNMDVANGITVSCRFIDAGGATLAESVITLSLGKIASVDFQRGDPLPGESPEQLRAEVRVQLDIFTYGISSDSLRRSLEVFNNNTGATTVYMGGAGS
jgi:hypothetical protein